MFDFVFFGIAASNMKSTVFQIAYICEDMTKKTTMPFICGEDPSLVNSPHRLDLYDTMVKYDIIYLLFSTEDGALEFATTLLLLYDGSPALSMAVPKLRYLPLLVFRRSR